MTRRNQPALGVEHEHALQRVVTGELEVDAERRILGAVARRLADEHRRARHGREDRVGERGAGAGRALVRLELRVGLVAKLDGALPPWTSNVIGTRSTETTSRISLTRSATGPPALPV